MFVLSLAAACAAAQLSESEQREIEESIGADTAPAPQLEPAPVAPPSSSANPNISLVLDAAGAWFDANNPLLGGAHDPEGSGVTLQQLELYAFSNIDPFFRIDAAAVFVPSGVELEEAYATTLALPLNLQARGGRFLTRFGRINEKHPHSWSFTLQPLAVGRFLGSEGARGNGLELSWLVPLPWFAELVASATYDGGGEHAHGGDAEESDRLHLDDALFTAALEQFFPVSDDWSVLWGISASSGTNVAGEAADAALAGTDLYIRYRPLDTPGRSALSLQIEIIARRDRAGGATHTDAGGYAELVWQPSLEWSSGARAEYVLGDEHDPLFPEARARYTAMLTYHPSHFSRLRLEGVLDRPEWRESPIWGAVLQLEVVAGAHGAHGY